MMYYGAVHLQPFRDYVFPNPRTQSISVKVGYLWNINESKSVETAGEPNKITIFPDYKHHILKIFYSHLMIVFYSESKMKQQHSF